MVVKTHPQFIKGFLNRRLMVDPRTRYYRHVTNFVFADWNGNEQVLPSGVEVADNPQFANSWGVDSLIFANSYDLSGFDKENSVWTATKKPTMIFIAEEAGRLQTLEGESDFVVGSPIAIGVNDEMWVVGDGVFKHMVEVE